MLSRIRLVVVTALLLPVLFLPAARAQGPIALPNTFSTVGGGAASAFTTGEVCSPGSSLTATDTFGDGCPATLAQFSSDLRGGVATDPAGNIYVLDTNNSVVRVINARSGIVTLFAGKGTVCAAKTDSNGDNCPLANTAFSATPRGIASDPYGNIIVAGYGSNLVNLLCNAASPLCPNTLGTHQIGSMYLVAGCVATTGSAGTATPTPGTVSDGGTATPTGTCNASVATLDQARGVAADRYGNVYIADTANLRYRVVLGPSSYNGVTNPLFSIISLNPAYSTPIAGNIYPLLYPITTPAAGSPCATNSAANSLDAFGDGCPYYLAALNSPGTSAIQGIAVDPSGNILINDLSSQRLRVIYLGGTQMAAVITANNSTVTTPTVGSIYAIAGGGASAPASAPNLGKNVTIDTNGFKITTDSAGNIYIGDSTFVLFLDINTGYIRKLIATGAVCSGATDSIGDGCSATQATFGGSNGIGIAFNSLGDLFLADTNNARVRRVAATSLLPTAVNSSSTQNILLHGAPGTTSLAASLANIAATNPITPGTPSCGSVLADTTLDCLVPVTFAPPAPGTHTSTLAAVPAGVSTAATLPLIGTATGAALAFDGSDAIASVVGSALKSTGLVTDGNGNLFTYDSNSSTVTEVNAAGTATHLPGTLLGVPKQLALDASGNLYAVGDGSASITRLTLGSNGSYTAGTVAFTPNGSAATPQAIAIDSNGELFVYDNTSKTVYRQSQSTAGTLVSTVAAGFNDVVSLALDNRGNLFVSDPGTQSIYTINAAGVQSTLASNISAVAIATDPAGNLYAQDVLSNSIFEYPVSGPKTTVSTTLTTPSGLAVDLSGNVFAADTAQTGLLLIPRSVTSIAFGTNAALTRNGTITNIGNASATGLAQTDSADFQLAAGSANGCNISATSIATGVACTVTASFTPQSGTGNVTDAVTLLPASSSGSLSLTGIKNGAAVTTTTSIVGQTPASPIFSANGSTEVSFTVTVAASAGTASGSVAVTVDSGLSTSYPLNSSGQAVVNLSGLTAGSHILSATYASQNGFTGSTNAAPINFSIAQAAVTISWTPATTAQSISSPLGLGVLNATATLQGTSTQAPGNFVYTATPSGGSATPIDASSYLAIGSYALNVTFVPADSVDYLGGSSSVASYTVTSATTTAAIGGTQNLVAADGTGNFTSVQTALNSLPTTGGSIYIKPGTYTGFITVNLPNVSLRGLGGDPTKVILTNEGGAFSPPYLAGQSAGNNGATGDQGSATLVVAKGTLNSITATPNNFYMEGVTVTNTYDTDTTNANSVGTVGGNCQTISATNNQTLYNGANTAGSPGLCSSQALAMWITGDQAVLNNIYLTSLQDTLYAGSQGCGATCTVSRQYYWRGKITGDVDYVFGDAAAVFDHTSIYSLFHGASPTGTVTIEAQNKRFPTGGTGDYLSGYVFNSAVFTSQAPGMTQLYFGRPYGQYSTNILLNSYVDQVNPVGYIEFSGDTNLPTSTYAEFNTIPYTDPVTGSPDLNGVIYTGTGGNTGTGVSGPRETTSIQPTTFTAAQAAAFFPINFLSSPVTAASLSTGETTTWDPTLALATGANAFVPSGAAVTIATNSPFTVLMRPQTPGAGTIPTGTWQLFDNSTSIASGTLDASGQAFYTSSTLAAGAHSFTWIYGGDSNFSGSTTTTPFVVTVSASTQTPLISIQPAANATYGTASSVTVTVSATIGTTIPSGAVSLSIDSGAPQMGTLSSAGAFTFPVPSLTAGGHTLSVSYTGTGNFLSTSSNGSISVAKATLQVTANNITVMAGQPVPAYSAAITGFITGDSLANSVTGSPSLTTSPASPTAAGVYPITAALGGLVSANYTFAFTNGTLTIQGTPQAPAVATGDTRTVTEPTIPTVCTTLTAALTSVNDDIPASVDATGTNPDGARIQAALNSCANSSQAVRLSVDNAGHNAYLTGPLNMPSGVTLLVDPGVIVYFSRNAQDYDLVPGTHTCGTVNSASATSSCQPLININGVSNTGIMGFGKLDGRGGDTVLNTFPASYAGQSWWGLSAIANSGGNQQNPRFIQLTNATNVTLYKITLRNSPLFHISTTGGEGVSGFTAWDIKIVTPTSSRNTDGIDPDNSQNVTITRSWISDGDDNIAVGSSGAGNLPSQNISFINNRLFAGHGESIGSFTSSGVNNVLFDSNVLAGNSSVDSNSTGIRIKSGNDRGGVVQNIQYSNSCFQNHKTEIQFTPLYDTTAGTFTPNFKNILMQNLAFLTEGTVQFTGANNNGSTFPLIAALDNVSFTTLSASDFNAAPTLAQLTLGPGQVSSNFVTAYQNFVGANGNTLIDNRSTTSLLPPVCSFTFIAPELTGPAGLPQTVTSGQTATAVVLLTPAVGGSAYPTGTVTLTNESSQTTTVTLPGTGDTLFIPLPNLPVGTHTYTATYSGDSSYVPSMPGAAYSTAGPYTITVNPGSLYTSTTTLAGAPATATFGNPITLTATVTGSNPTGSVQFVVNGASYANVGVASGTAQTTLNLPIGSYTLSAIYSGDSANTGSVSSSASLTVAPASTTTALTVSPTTTTLGVPVTLTATITSAAGTPTGTVSFTYTTATSTSPTTIASSTLTNGIATTSANLPIGIDNVTASFVASGSFAPSSSTPAVTVTVNPPIAVPLPTSPEALPYIISTLAGGSTVASANTACAGSVDSFGDGCQATSIVFNGSSLDLRSVVADPFGNVYLTDANASLIRRIAPNGVITNFAGYVSGTACVPTATTSCTPTLVKLNKPRGISVDAFGNLYIAGYSDSKVYKVSVSTGMLSLVAGTGTKPSDPTAANGDGSAATSALINQPRGIWADTVGNTYIADTADNKIRVVNSTGTIQTLTGTGAATSTGDNGPASAATVNNPQGVLTDASDNVYIADSARIRVVCVTCTSGSGLYQLLTKVGVASPQNGYIYTLAGGGAAPYAGPALANTITMSPQKLAIDAGGNLYISDGSGAIWFVDSRTAYIHAIAGGTSTTCNPTATPDIGDGCPATQAVIGDGGNGIGVGTDTLGNIYISDTLNARIRKVSTNLHFASTATAATTSQTVQLHYIAGDTAAATNSLTLASTEWSLATPTCITNADTTTDCLISVSFTPAVPGYRSSPLTVSSSAGNRAFLGLTGTALGAGATLDPATQSAIGQNLQITALATDNAGNLYVSDAESKNLLRFAPTAIAKGTGATSTTLATLTAPGPIAVDARGFVYVADTTTGQITQVAPSGVASTLPFKLSTPSGLAVDALNNLYASDSAAQSVYQLNPITGAQRTLALGTLYAPAGLTIDLSGNLLVADPGGAAIYRFNLQSGVRTGISSTAAKPSAIVADAAGNLIIADTASILALPASANSSQFTVASLTPSALAIDAAGNLYTTFGNSIFKLTRSQGAALFVGTSSTPQAVSLLASGNQPSQISSVVQTDTTDFALSAASSTDCTLNGSLPASLAIGGVCTLTAGFTPQSMANVADTATFNGNLVNAALSTPAQVQLVLTGQTSAPTATITLGAFSPAQPVFGQSVTVSASVTATSGIPTGIVTFTVDGSSTVITLVNGSAATTLTGLAVGSHMVTATYTSSNGFASATTTPVTLTVASSTPTINPTTLTLAASPAIPSAGLPQGTSETFRATLAGGVSATGTVTFFDGTTALGSPASLSNNTAIYTTSTLAPGSHSITAHYSGDATNAASTATAISFTTLSSTPSSFALTTAASNVNVPSGSSATATLSITPSGPYNGTVTFSCAGAPAGLTCGFNPASLSFASSSSTPQTTTLTFTATSAAALVPLGSNLSTRLAALFGLPGTLLLFLRRRNATSLRNLTTVLLLLAASFGVIGAVGCGNSATPTTSTGVSITINATDGTNQHSVPVYVTITH